MVSWEFPPLIVGGLGRHVGELARELAQRGHDVRVLTRGGSGPAGTDRYRGVTVHRANADGVDLGLSSESVLAWTLAFEHSLIRAGLQLLGGWRPDVIHAHDWLVAQTARTLQQVLGCALVVTVHATEYGRQQGWLADPVPRAIHSVERWLIQAADEVLVCSDFMRREISRLFTLAPTVIGNGVTPVGSSTASWPTGEPLLAFAGRLVHEKGLQELIKALPLLLPEFPQVRLVVAGTGSQQSDQQDRAERYGVAHLIDWVGFLEPADVAGLFAAADVAVVPSVYEPFGLVAIEAQLAGTPVAVSDTGGLSELVEPGISGFRFPVENPAAIAESVRRMMQEPQLAAAMAARAQHIALTRHSWAAVAERTLAGYQRAIAHHAG